MLELNGRFLVFLDFFLFLDFLINFLFDVYWKDEVLFCLLFVLCFNLLLIFGFFGSIIDLFNNYVCIFDILEEIFIK